ncbi:MAG: MG2 domain-containing protein [Planctomycetaceae bacterium]|nr:MG2 domain-containing protein [Planctomycetaceae bacterium]
MSRLFASAAVVGAVTTAFWLMAAEPPSETAMRTQARKQFQDGNFQQAVETYRKLLLNADSDPTATADDLQQTVQALENLGKVDEVDKLIEDTVAAHAAHWRVLQAAAQLYLRIEKYGQRVAGVVHRGHRRGGGEQVILTERDRSRALQLFEQARPLVEKETVATDAGRFWLNYATAFQPDYSGCPAWKLQVLTDLAVLADYEVGYGLMGRGLWGRGGGEDRGAPVDADGNPVFYHVPTSYAEAKNDGERWRWLLAQAKKTVPTLRDEADSTWARFLHSQFGVQTMAGILGAQSDDDDQSADNAGPFAVHTLKDDETIAKLATGVKRFALPDEFNPLKVFQSVAADFKNSHGGAAADIVAQIYEDRRQYVKAAAAWKTALDKFGDEDHRQQRHQQIVGHWGQFEQLQVQPAGQGATVDFRFRNGKKVQFTAHAVKLTQLLDDVKNYIKQNPKQLDWNQLNVGDIGYRLITEGQSKYLGEQVANWSLDLDPKPEHVDRRIEVATPLQKAGVYLLEGKLADGNTSRIVVWLADTALVKKPLDQKSWYYVADAVTGQPIPKANVEFFGWKQEPVRPNQNAFRVVTKNFAQFTDADGQVLLDPKQMPQDHQWLITARTDAGRLAYLGFTGVWFGRKHDEQYQQTKVYAITDRPVYRPGQKVQFKFWLQQAKYDQPDGSPFANKGYTVEIHDPQGNKVYEKAYKTDKFGGLEGEWPLVDDAKLGQYQLLVKDHGGGSFRVEEYKKPEFEVSVEAPKEPVALGEKITATITAKYYFGAPVTHARVKYKVQRTTHTATWYPPGRWDWFYGKGYWWFGYDYAWYPGWSKWGCVRPIPPWWGRSPAPPELIAEQEVDIGPDGTLKVEIDTLPAKELHGDEDHSYQITAEVVDESRRTIVGQGNVLVARKPFRVYAWVDRGHYKVGDTVHAHFAAYTLDQQPVPGTGKLTLFRIQYDAAGQPQETAVQTWDLNPNAEGQAEQQIVASQAGQYRLSYTVTDDKQRSIEGGYVFVVLGQGFDGRQYRFNDLELITDKKEYAPGDTVQLLINTNRSGSAVALFVRPSNGVYLPPKIIRIPGKSTVEAVAVTQKDMPNFFIEAVTVADSRYHEELREVVVPPEKRVINVDVQPSQTEYQPGAPATVEVKLTDKDGKPFVGSTVLSVYDRSVEYIAGGSNVPEIRKFFWKWRRHHHPQHEGSLDRSFANLLRPNETGMATLGAFGEVGLMDDGVNQGIAMNGGLRNRRTYPKGTFAGLQSHTSRNLTAAPMAESVAMPVFAVDVMDTGGDAAVQPTVRSEFADTAYWNAAVTTDADGFAKVDFKMPENLTGWKVKAWAMGLGAKVGEGTADVVTKKNLLVRLQAPRFFVETDEVVLSANIHNDLADDKSVRAVLELDGGCLESLAAMKQDVMIPAHGELRVDWRVKVLKEGTAVVRMKALTNVESDAMEMKFPVYVHGMLKTESFSGALRPKDEKGELAFSIPEQRRINESRIEARFSPTLAGAMVDALPYLVEYPYGCTEQTLNRFLPTVVTQRILQRTQLDLKAIQAKRTNLNAQEIGDANDRAKQWKRFDRNPVFDEAEVAKMVADGLEKLTAMQLSDGGWGWFSGHGEHSWPHTTAVVVHGLQTAAQNDVALVPGVLEKGVAWLKTHQSEQVRLLKNAATETKPWKSKADALDAFVYMVLVDADVANDDMQQFLFRDRVSLPVYAKALFGLALQKQQQAEQLAMIVQNIEQFLVQDDENQTAYLKLPDDNWWWSWHGSSIEANAYFLKLLTRINPQDARCSRLVKYLLNNRKHATYWNSTRDTAYCIEALAEYLVASGEDQPDLTVEVWLNGKKQQEVAINKDNLFTFDNAFVVTGDAVATGKQTLEFRKRGTGPLYYSAYVTNFTLEDFIEKAGLEVKVQRKYHKLTRVDKTVDVAGSRGQAATQTVEKYERSELANLAELTSGDLVEVELEIDSKNDYEYLVFEDMKAAGFEPVDLRSGYTGNALGAYVEFRDERTAFFVRALPRGKHSVSYRLRAEIPGKFSALPTRASAMYAPELRGNSDEIKLNIVDRDQ